MPASAGFSFRIRVMLRAQESRPHGIPSPEMAPPKRMGKRRGRRLRAPHGAPVPRRVASPRPGSAPPPLLAQGQAAAALRNGRRRLSRMGVGFEPLARDDDAQ